jgi:hypothetical protein
MSESDLPARLFEYGAGENVTLKRIALTWEQVSDLPSFPATDKKKDPRFRWFTTRHGELDAMDPNDLREIVTESIQELIEPDAWERCDRINRAERESLKTIISNWGAGEGRS